ncbi:MAG: hypothetical protein Q7S51_11455, partial [Gallionellaceae bacterium]|nr:hypothetical protein [Gallionellaceae bacterium]
MHTIKQTIIIVMLGFFALGISSPPSYADTLSDLKAQCYQACHDVIVSPSGWVLSGTSGAGAKAPAEKTLAGWESTIAAMGDGKCGFTTIGPGGTSRSVSAQYLLDKQNILPPTPTFISTPTVTYTPTPTSMCIWATPVPTPIGGCVGGYVALSAPYCPENVFVCFTPTATPTPTYTPTPTLTASPTPTPVTPTATSSGP